MCVFVPFCVSKWIFRYEQWNKLGERICEHVCKVRMCIVAAVNLLAKWPISLNNSRNIILFHLCGWQNCDYFFLQKFAQFIIFGMERSENCSNILNSVFLLFSRGICYLNSNISIRIQKKWEKTNSKSRKQNQSQCELFVLNFQFRTEIDSLRQITFKVRSLYFGLIWNYYYHTC